MKILDLPAWSPALSDSAPLATGSWTTFKGTLQQIFDLFNSTGWNADFYKYSISSTVDGSGNMTVSLLNYLGGTPSTMSPVKIQIGDTIRTISSALSVTKNAWTNWCNSGSVELATKEIDYFTYIGYNTIDGVTIWFSRIPFAVKYSDFSTTTTNEKYAGISTITNATAPDPYVNIGRFNATLSAGAGYTWSIPATSVIVNSPINETRWLEISPTITGYSVLPTTTEYRYKLVWDICTYRLHANTNGTSNATLITITAPFGASQFGATHWTWSFMAVDAWALQTNPWLIYYNAVQSNIEFYKNWAFGAWTNTLAKNVKDWIISYKI